MFLKEFIYFDETLIREYGSQLSQNFLIEFKKINTETNEKTGLELGQDLPVGAQMKKAKSQELEGILINTISNQYKNFEELLSNSDVYLNFLENDEITDLTTAGRGTIVTVEGIFSIPSEFDKMELVDENKELIFQESPMDTEMANKFLEKIFIEKNNCFIPLKLKLGEEEVSAFAKINKNKFIKDYDLIDEFENEYLVFTFKSNGYRKIKTDKVVFSMTKDLFGLSRSMRRELSKTSSEKIEGIEDIKMKENYLDIELIAIYK